MNFIGIDPSTSSTGFAVMNEHQELLRYGTIKGLADDPKSFAHLYAELNELLEVFLRTASFAKLNSLASTVRLPSN